MAVNFSNGGSKIAAKTGTQSAPSTPSFLKTGSAAKALLEQEEAKAEQRKEEQGKLWRFSIKKDLCGQDFRFTFLDGDLTPEGMIDCPMWREHTVHHNGRWQNYIAIDDEPDPVQETTERDASFVFGLSGIDHTEVVSKDGKVFKDRKKLFVGKRKTLGVLLKIAQKRGGLAGATFDITRTNDEAAAVGDMFEFVGKTPLEELQATFGEAAIPANFAEELTYYNADQLRKMGFGVKNVVGTYKPSKDYSAEL